MTRIANRLTVEQYDRMVENGILPETNRFELIFGRIVEKDVKGPKYRVTAGYTERNPAPGSHQAGTPRRKNRSASPTGRASRSQTCPWSAVPSRITRTATRDPEMSPWSSRSRSHERGQGPKAGPRVRTRRYPGLLDRQRAEAQARSLCPPRTGGPGRGAYRLPDSPGDQVVDLVIAGQIVGQIPSPTSCPLRREAGDQGGLRVNTVE